MKRPRAKNNIGKLLWNLGLSGSISVIRKSRPRMKAKFAKATVFEPTESVGCG